MRLKELQRRFTASAFGAIDPAFAGAVSGGGKLTSREAVGVYRKGYPARLSEALGETFEACWRVLGDEDFLKACEAYARSTPSVSHNLSDYGATFPDFLLKRFKAHAPFIADLARLEWAFKELFHAAPHAAAGPQRLADAHDGSVLVFGSAVRLLPAKHAVHAIWKRDRADDRPLKPADWRGPEAVLLYKRGGNEVFSTVLAAPDAAALTALMAGRPLAASLAGAKGLDENGAGRLFSFMASAGLIAELR